MVLSVLPWAFLFGATGGSGRVGSVEAAFRLEAPPELEEAVAAGEEAAMLAVARTSASAQRRWERRFTALNRATSRPSCARKVFVEERERRARVTDEGGPGPVREGERTERSGRVESFSFLTMRSNCKTMRFIANLLN